MYSGWNLGSTGLTDNYYRIRMKLYMVLYKYVDHVTVSITGYYMKLNLGKGIYYMVHGKLHYLTCTTWYRLGSI